jgi:hypothetical protein
MPRMCPSKAKSQPLDQLDKWPFAQCLSVLIFEFPCEDQSYALYRRPGDADFLAFRGTAFGLP